MRGANHIMAKKQAFTIDNENKVVIIDPTVKKTADDRADIAMYLQGGYTSRNKVIRKLKDDAITRLKDKDILEALKNDEANSKKYKELKKEAGKGFFAARSWYATEVLKK